MFVGTQTAHPMTRIETMKNNQDTRAKYIAIEAKYGRRVGGVEALAYAKHRRIQSAKIAKASRNIRMIPGAPKGYLIRGWIIK